MQTMPSGSARARGSVFSEAVQYAPKKLEMESVTPKEEQLQSIFSVYGGKSVFVWLPTGFGKSMCYQALPFVMDYKLGTPMSSVVVVVSPLISLIVDQVENLRNRGVSSSVITSGSDLVKPYLATEASICTDSLLFCAPEALALPKWENSFDKSCCF